MLLVSLLINDNSCLFSFHKVKLLLVVQEKYDNAIQEKYGSNVSQPEIGIEAWCEATQVPCKGSRLYGLGIQRKSLHKDVTSSGSPMFHMMDMLISSLYKMNFILLVRR
ncbi:Hypothetical predicted protein [Olea europaea subsp. europaea]|uniref:Uncharacterized protein n=1 Tax=Olea europaea subsp. europaea TaxID=158383 RepID=A0A8S0RFE6_OLEEU|nr:Hypothetical predicted protein [Olea europaea subsp. europaea]